MKIRPYQDQDKPACLAIFESNCPLYFDAQELDLFENWLNHQSTGSPYQSPTYTDAAFDAYFVAVDTNEQVLACAGFYVVKELPEARLAWGMVHAAYHHQGLGTALLAYRKAVIKEKWPAHQITLGTSQYTYPFYEKMGFTVQEITLQGYGPNIDKIEMIAI
jgi:predicted GNAT family N-acyltransferase